jgi:hypothetical protein
MQGPTACPVAGWRGAKGEAERLEPGTSGADHAARMFQDRMLRWSYPGSCGADRTGLPWQTGKPPSIMDAEFVCPICH